MEEEEEEEEEEAFLIPLTFALRRHLFDFRSRCQQKRLTLNTAGGSVFVGLKLIQSRK